MFWEWFTKWFEVCCHLFEINTKKERDTWCQLYSPAIGSVCAHYIADGIGKKSQLNCFSNCHCSDSSRSEIIFWYQNIVNLNFVRKCRRQRRRISRLFRNNFHKNHDSLLTLKTKSLTFSAESIETVFLQLPNEKKCFQKQKQKVNFKFVIVLVSSRNLKKHSVFLKHLVSFSGVALWCTLLWTGKTIGSEASGSQKRSARDRRALCYVV